MSNGSYDSREYNTIEKVGIFALPFFITGFVFYLTGAFFYIYDNWTSMSESLSLFLLPLLIGIPFAIQIPIFYRFHKVSKQEISPNDENIPVNERGLNIFFKYYCWFMCVGLLGYSISWLLYNTRFTKLASAWLTSVSIICFLFILLLIWIIGRCTRILIQSGKQSGLLTLSDLSKDQYQALCFRLNTILLNAEILDKKEEELRKIITTKHESFEDDQRKVSEIIDVFSSLENLKLPLTNKKSPIIETLLSILTDKNEPAQIKPLRRVLNFLESQADEGMHRAIKEKKDLSSVPKRRLIKSLNKILMNYNFYEKKEFSSGDTPTPIHTAAGYFETNKKNVHHYLAEKVQIANRKLFDMHLFPFLNDKGASFDSDSLREENASPTSLSKKDEKKSILKFRLNDYRERKILEGISRFPFHMILFFFTTFLCIVYLFSFSFAFHDLATLADSKTKTPALFMDADYLNPGSDNKFDLPIEKESTFFFFYTLANSATEFKNISNEIPQEDLQSQRYIANKQSLDNLLEVVKKTAPAAKKIFIEIVGRTDDTPINKQDPNTKQTFASNYDLSLARAQNLRFDLLRRLENYPGVIEKIEWSCLPGSNDSSLIRDFPLNHPSARPSLALIESPGIENTENNDLNPEEQKRVINNVAEQLRKEEYPKVKDLALEDQLSSKRSSLEKHINSALKLLEKPATFPNKKSMQKLASSLDEEFKAYKTIKDEPGDSELDKKLYQDKANEFDHINQKINAALVFYASEEDKGNRRITEVYITSVPYTTSSNPLNIMDYILYSITNTGYGDVKPTTLYAKFLSVLINIVSIFFLVVFFNALLSVKRVGEEDDLFN